METPLNPKFIKRLQNQYSPLITDQIIRGFSSEKSPVIRINTLKTTTREIMKILRDENILFERIDFLPDALIIKNEDEKYFENLDIYKKGFVYFQGISSQLPVIFLNPHSGENILDLAAAPGSKTTQIGIMMGNKGHIFANEINEIRYKRLQYNIEKQGITIAEVHHSDGCIIGNLFPEKFDRVLLDAPCSAEGRINFKGPRTYKFWSEKNIIKNAKLQKRLFLSAYKALKKGGILVYSTCTLAPEENEDIVDWALSKFLDLKICKINLNFKYKLPSLNSACFKAMPSQICEGFFIAMFKKML